jgi:hypothetical protein
MEPLYEIIFLTSLFLFLIVHGHVSGPKIYSFLLKHVIALLLAFSISYLYFNYKN